MRARLMPFEVAPGAYQVLVSVEAYLRNCALEHRLMDLVRMRVSQINGCAFCLDMHSTHARRAGESEQRLYLLDAWRESPLYDPRERAALAWAEALTRIAETHAPDEIYDQARAEFTEEELVNLTAAIGMINLWNRIAIGFRSEHAGAVVEPGDRRRAAT